MTTAKIDKMTTLEQRIAEAVYTHEHEPYDTKTWDDPDLPSEVRGEYLDLARAVVAVLPTADVSDEAIREALLAARTQCPCETPGCPDIRPVGEWGVDRVLPSVRALLDAQAAAHAAEVEALRKQLDTAMAYNASLSRLNAKFEADRDRLLDILNELGICPKDGESMPCMTCGAGL